MCSNRRFCTLAQYISVLEHTCVLQVFKVEHFIVVMCVLGVFYTHSEEHKNVNKSLWTFNIVLEKTYSEHSCVLQNLQCQVLNFCKQIKISRSIGSCWLGSCCIQWKVNVLLSQAHKHELTCILVIFSWYWLYTNMRIILTYFEGEMCVSTKCTRKGQAWGKLNHETQLYRPLDLWCHLLTDSEPSSDYSLTKITYNMANRINVKCEKLARYLTCKLLIHFVCCLLTSIIFKKASYLVNNH